MAEPLAGRLAVVTGASSGIGAAVALTFARAGAQVVLAARRADRLDELVRAMPAGRGIPCPVDLTREGDVLRLFETAREVGELDLLVNNAGRAVSLPTVDLPTDLWRETIDINLTAAFLCAREALRVMIPRQRGRIINVGSISAKLPRQNSLAYTASKFGLEGLTRGLALEARPYGITVSMIHPGATDTELGGGGADRSRIGPAMMAAETVADIVLMMASLPDAANLLEATVLPIAQPFLGRG